MGIISSIFKKSPDRKPSLGGETEQRKHPVASATSNHFGRKMKTQLAPLPPMPSVPVKKTEFPEVQWEEMPHYHAWVMQEAQDLVVRLLGDTEEDGKLLTYPGLITYLAPTGRFFFPTAFFTHKYEYVDPTAAGFVLDTSKCNSKEEVRVMVMDCILILPNKEPVRLPLDDYKRNTNVANPLR